MSANWYGVMRYGENVSFYSGSRLWLAYVDKKTVLGQLESEDEN